MNGTHEMDLRMQRKYGKSAGLHVPERMFKNQQENAA
jgi:hypothetical protein